LWVFTGDTVYDLHFTDGNTYNLPLLYYMEYRKSSGGDTYYWRTEDSPGQFYEDMAAEKVSLPEYVINFQKAWEMILVSLLRQTCETGSGKKKVYPDEYTERIKS
jgi:hypothetical protein